MDTWLFGYGSLIWRPDFHFVERKLALACGWSRRFWQGSHDHRGLPHAPGRVVTLVPEASAQCEGMAYRIDATVMEQTFSHLDHREKNGYERHDVELRFRDGHVDNGIVYIAALDNHAFLGPASMQDMVEQIATSCGPSGRNSEYLLELASALRDFDIVDDHVFELEAAVRAHLEKVP